MAPEGKIKSKDLTYDSSLPPFLQRLRAQNAGSGDQDRHERPIARPKRAKAHDDEDEPTVIDESGETVSKAELDQMTAAENKPNDVEEGGNVTGSLDGEGEAMVSGALPNAKNAPKSEQKMTDGVAVKKRKVAKVVGEEDDGAEEGSSNAKKDQDGSVKKAAKKVKKSKSIKLAFDDGDET